MQMPCCGEEESKQQMSGTAPPGKSISGTVPFVPLRAPAIEYKVGSEMKHGPGTSCISSSGFQRRTVPKRLLNSFIPSPPTGATDCASQPTAMAHLCFFL